MSMKILEIHADRLPNDLCWRFYVDLDNRKQRKHWLEERRNLIKLFDKYWDTKAVSFHDCGDWTIRGLIYFKNEETMCDFIMTKDRLIGKKL
jgi:hypothetical protein